MKVANRKAYLCAIKLDHIFFEPLCIPKVSKELTATHKAHNKQDLVLCLEHVAHAHKERVGAHLHDVLLENCRLQLLLLNYVMLIDRLHRIYFAFLGLTLNEEDFSKGATTNDLMDGEIVQCDFFVKAFSRVHDNTRFALILGHYVIRVDWANVVVFANARK